MKYLKSQKEIIVIFFIWVAIVNVFALIALNRFNLTSDTAYSWIPKEYYQEQGLNFNVIHAQWDSFWLLDIVENGYYLRGGDISNIVFFPVYPALIKGISFVVHDSLFVGWAVSVISLLFALIFFDRLIREFYPQVKSLEAIIFLLLFPTAYFFNTFYTESLFLFLSIITIYYAKKDKKILVMLFGFLAALTRVTGILLFVPIVWYLFQDNQFKLQEVIKWRNLYILVIPFGTLLFFFYHHITFDSFLLFFEIESLWGRSFAVNYDHFSATQPVEMTNLLLDGLLVLFALVCTGFVWKKIDKGLALYMFATIGVAVSTGTLMSIGRYILILFPIYIFAASIKNMHIKFAWLLFSCMLFALYTILFVNHYWAG